MLDRHILQDANAEAGMSNDLPERLHALEAQAAGLSLAQVMTRAFAGEIRYCSRGVERLYRFTAAEALGRIPHELLGTEFPISRGAVEELLAREERTGGLRHRRSDGREIIVASHQSLCRDTPGATPLVTEVNNDNTEAWR